MDTILETDLEKNIESDKIKDIKETNTKKIEEPNNKILDFLCHYSYTLFIINSLILLCSFIVLTVLTVLYNSDLDKFFWINQLIKYFLVSIIQYTMSLLIIYKDIRVNYTRKVIHISYFLWPQLLDILLIKYEKNKFTEFWNVWIILFLLLALSEHVRKKIGIIDMMFKAVDRPEAGGPLHLQASIRLEEVMPL